MSDIGLLFLGGIAGLTIFLGIPIALIPARQKLKNFLNAIAIGILIFLVVDVLEHAWDKTSEILSDSLNNQAPLLDGITLLITMFLGIAIGLIGLAIYQDHFMSKASQNKVTSDILSPKQINLQNVSATKLSLMIAIGIGVHNFSEGLAIGQSYASNEINLALLLIIGFGAHNATEGFGIVSPLAGSNEKPSILYLIQLGIIGGAPTFLGTLIGSFWVSHIAYVLFLSLAAGALIFVILLMNASSGKNIKLTLLMLGIFIGLTAGFMTDLLISIAGA